MPIVLNPHLLDAILKVKELSSRGASSVGYLQALEDLERSLDLRPRGEQSSHAQAGTILEPELIKKLYPNMQEGVTHKLGTWMPPIKIGSNIVMTGKPDVVVLGPDGKVIGVEDIKTTYRQGFKPVSPEAFPDQVFKRLTSYQNSSQSAYSTAFGVPLKYRMFGYESPYDVIAGKKPKPLVSRDSGNIQMPYEAIASRAQQAVEFVKNQMGGKYWEALATRGDKPIRTNAGLSTLFGAQAVQPQDEWKNQGLIIPHGFEHDDFKDAVLKSLIVGQEGERRADKEPLHFGGVSLNTTPTSEIAEDAAQQQAINEQAFAENLSKMSAEGQREYAEKYGITVQTVNDLRKGAHFIGRTARATSGTPGMETQWERRAKAQRLRADLAGVSPHMNVWSRWNADYGGRQDYIDFYRQMEETVYEPRAFEQKRHAAEFAARKRGDEEGANIISLTQTTDELEAALIDLAKAAREAKKAEEAKEKAAPFPKLHADFYDFSRWTAARASAWSETSDAFSWLPGRAFWGRLGTSYIQQEQAQTMGWSSKVAGISSAITPLLPLLSLLPGGSLAATGVKIGATALTGLGSASQIVGNFVEGDIRKQGLLQASMGNRMGAWVGLAQTIAPIAVSYYSLVAKTVLAPLKLFGSALRVAASGLVKLGTGISGVISSGMAYELGNPLLSMTGGTYADYQNSMFADLRLGASRGSWNEEVQRFASLQQLGKFGRFNETQLLDTILAGAGDFIPQLFFQGGGNAFRSIGDIIDAMAAKSPTELNTAALANSFPQIANAVELLRTWQKTHQGGWAEYTSPETYGIPFTRITDSELDTFREQQMSYGIYKESINIEKVRLASTLWNKFGESVLKLVRSFTAWLAQPETTLQSIATKLLDIAQSLLKELVPVFDIAKELFVGIGHDVIEMLRVIGPGVYKAFKDVFLDIHDMGIDVFFSLGETIWSSMTEVIRGFSSITFNPNKILDVLAGKATFGDLFAIDQNLTHRPDEFKGATITREGEGSFGGQWGVRKSPYGPKAQFYDTAASTLLYELAGKAATANVPYASELAQKLRDASFNVAVRRITDPQVAFQELLKDTNGPWRTWLLAQGEAHGVTDPIADLGNLLFSEANREGAKKFTRDALTTLEPAGAEAYSRLLDIMDRTLTLNIQFLDGDKIVAKMNDVLGRTKNRVANVNASQAGNDYVRTIAEQVERLILNQGAMR